MTVSNIRFGFASHRAEDGAPTGSASTELGLAGSGVPAALRRLTPAPLALAVMLALVPAAHAGEREELLELKNTIVNLVDALVAQQVLSAGQAAQLKAEAQAKAKTQAAAEAEARAKAGAPGGSADAAPPVDAPGQKVVRVPYVPEFVKEEIRARVRADLRRDVTEDVVAKAKAERWGTADALPDWVTRLSWSGELRLRYQGDYFDSENQPNSYADFAEINDAGSIFGPDTFFNFTEERDRLRAQLKLGLNAKVSDTVQAGVRITTGNETDPVSMNQTLGRDFNRYAVTLDRAFLRWGDRAASGDEWLVLTGGRIENPFFATSLVWDQDLSFEGVAGTVSRRFSLEDDLLGQEFRNLRVYATLGGFSLREAELAFDDGSSNDKWLLGGQLGFEHELANQSTYRVAATLYDYVNIVGRFNPNGAFGSTLFDWTAPGFVQKGNTLYPIKFNANGDPTLFGLAADYTVANLTGRLDLAHFAPVHVILTADYARNIGFDGGDVLRRAGVAVDAKVDAYQLQLDVGWPRIVEFGQWNVFAAYKHLQRDAVLDAYTDSDFHLGGTDAKGFILGGEYGLSRNTSLRMRYLSADAIDLAPLGIDVLQVDFNARF